MQLSLLPSAKRERSTSLPCAWWMGGGMSGCCTASPLARTTDGRLIRWGISWGLTDHVNHCSTGRFHQLITVVVIRTKCQRDRAAVRSNPSRLSSWQSRGRKTIDDVIGSELIPTKRSKSGTNVVTPTATCNHRSVRGPSEPLIPLAWISRVDETTEESARNIERRNSRYMNDSRPACLLRLRRLWWRQRRPNRQSVTSNATAGRLYTTAAHLNDDDNRAYLSRCPGLGSPGQWRP